MSSIPSGQEPKPMQDLGLSPHVSKDLSTRQEIDNKIQSVGAHARMTHANALTSMEGASEIAWDASDMDSLHVDTGDLHRELTDLTKKVGRSCSPLFAESAIKHLEKQLAHLKNEFPGGIAKEIEDEYGIAIKTLDNHHAWSAESIMERGARPLPKGFGKAIEDDYKKTSSHTILDVKVGDKSYALNNEWAADLKRNTALNYKQFEVDNDFTNEQVFQQFIPLLEAEGLSQTEIESLSYRAFQKTFAEATNKCKNTLINNDKLPRDWENQGLVIKGQNPQYTIITQGDLRAIELSYNLQVGTVGDDGFEIKDEYEVNLVISDFTNEDPDAVDAFMMMTKVED